MEIKVKRFDKTIPLPSYEELAAGFDFICRENIEIKSGELKAVPSNVAMEIPEGYVLLAVSRSSTAPRFGLSMPHSVGIIDPFYNGDDNEIMLIFYNFTNKKVIIKKGEKIAQGILIEYKKISFNEVDKLGASTVRTWKK